MTNTAMEHLRYFAQTLGPRPLGGEANRRAAEYAEKVMKAAGLTVERQTFPCMQWTQGTARLTVSGQEISARPAPYAKPVDAAGPAACVDTREALDMADLRGRVAVLRGAWTRQPLSPKDNPFWYPDEDREVVERLEGSGALALLLSCEGEAMIDDGRFTVPCALIAEADANAMKDGMTVHLHMDCARGQTRAFNVVGLLGSAEKRVCVSAHLDTKDGAPGALDDGAGAAAVLAAAQALSGETLPFAVEFALFSGEDNYANDGEVVFADTSLTTPGRYLFNVNIDGIGMRGCDTTVAFFDAPAPLEKAARALMGAGWSELMPWPQGDHSLFVMRGIPALALTSKDIFEAPLHSPNDNLGLVDADKVAQTVRFVRDLLLRFGQGN